MKQEIFSASFKKGSNKIYGSTGSSFNLVRPDSFAKLNGVPGLFTVLDKSKDFYIYEFKNNNKILEVNGDISEIISPGDDIKISYKEYSVGQFFIKNSGAGYAVGDLLDLTDENAIKNTFDNKSFGAILKVTKINSNGGIESLNVEYRGRHLFDSETKKECKLKGGYGSGAIIEVNFIHNNQITFVERTVLEIHSKNIATEVTIDSPINQYITSGKFSFEKWFLTTKHPNTTETVFNRELLITRDFTPHLRLPIIPGNTNVLESHYNKSISILDQKIEKLENIIDKLS